MFSIFMAYFDMVYDTARQPAVWIPLGIAVWVGTIYLAAKGSNSWEKEEGIMLGALVGAVLGFVSPILLALLPVFMIVGAVIVVVIFAGIAVAKLLGVDK